MVNKTDKYQKAVGELDRLIEKSTKKVNLKAGLTLGDLWYQFFAKPRMGNNFYSVTVTTSIALLIVLIIILIIFP